MRQAPDTVEFRLYFNPGTNPPVPDPHEPTSWADRIHVTPFADAVAVSPDGSDRTYEVFLPQPGGAVFATRVPLAPTLADPIQYAHSRRSRRPTDTHTDDDPRWAASAHRGTDPAMKAAWAPTKVFCVKRDRPDPSAVPPDSDRVYASPADYHAASYYTFRWVPQANLRTLVFRALDESVFALDRRARPRSALGAGDLALFPSTAVEPRWDAVKRAQVATELNGLNAFLRLPPTPLAPWPPIARSPTTPCRSPGRLCPATSAPSVRSRSSRSIRRTAPTPTGWVRTIRRPSPSIPICVRTSTRWTGAAATATSTARPTSTGRTTAVRCHSLARRVWLPNVVAPRAPSLTSVTGGERQIRGRLGLEPRR